VPFAASASWHDRKSGAAARSMRSDQSIFGSAPDSVPNHMPDYWELADGIAGRNTAVIQTEPIQLRRTTKASAKFCSSHAQAAPACARSNTRRVFCATTRRSFLNGRHRIVITVCKRSKLTLLRRHFRPIRSSTANGIRGLTYSMWPFSLGIGAAPTMQFTRRGSDGCEQLWRVYCRLADPHSRPAIKTPRFYSRALQSQQVRGVSRKPSRAVYGARRQPAEPNMKSFTSLPYLRRSALFRLKQTRCC
jgi:hypothetical protein